MAMRMLMLTMMAPTKTTQKTVPPGASNCLGTVSRQKWIKKLPDLMRLLEQSHGPKSEEQLKNNKN